MGWHRRSLHVPVGPCGSLRVLVQPGLILHSLLWVHQGDAESPWKRRGGGGEASEHPGALAEAGGSRGAAGLLPITRGACPAASIEPSTGMEHRAAFPAGSLGNEPGHRESARGHLGQGWPQRHRATSEILRAGMLAHYLWQGHRGLSWPPRGRGGHILPLRGDSCAGSPRGTVQRIVQGSAGHPKTPPSQESSPCSQGHPAIRWERGQLQKASSSSGVTARPEAQWGAEGFGVIPPEQ